MSIKHIPSASEREIEYVRALSREATVNAYAKWHELSKTEAQYIELFIRPAHRVLDLGCGAGRIPLVLGSKLGEYLGIDCSGEMINKAKELNPGRRFACEDILVPSYTDHDFDVVLLMNNVIDMLHPFERREALFRLVRNVLAPSGVMICSSHLSVRESAAGYHEEEYHGAIVNTYRSSFGEFCEEVERQEFQIAVAARDYRVEVADWAYIGASKASN